MDDVASSGPDPPAQLTPDPPAQLTPDPPAQLRREYTRAGLSETDLVPDPIAQFERWFDAAVQAGVPEPNAMVVATADATGRPSARTVLLKGFDARGFTFYTNYDSRKGRELADNPRAALVFRWDALERQVLCGGAVARVDDAEADAYFASRPRGSRIAAWVSAQSTVLAGRDQLDARRDELTARFAGGDVQRPPFWGGFRVAPDEVEFWQGRPDRLHDRLRYRLAGDKWVIERLSP